MRPATGTHNAPIHGISAKSNNLRLSYRDLTIPHVDAVRLLVFDQKYVLIIPRLLAYISNLVQISRFAAEICTGNEIQNDGH